MITTTTTTHFEQTALTQWSVLRTHHNINAAYAALAPPPSAECIARIEETDRGEVAVCAVDGSRRMYPDLTAAQQAMLSQ